MPQFFFMVREQSGEIECDPQATELPSVADALCLAERKIFELRRTGAYQPPGPMMIVKDGNHRTVLSVPFYPGF